MNRICNNDKMTETIKMHSDACDKVATMVQHREVGCTKVETDEITSKFISLILFLTLA